MIRCNNARHPVLLLRQSQTNPNISSSTSSNSIGMVTLKIIIELFIRVLYVYVSVGNSVELNSSSSSLVISGPNAGGKTIVLKTCGLFALMVSVIEINSFSAGPFLYE